MNGAAGLCSFRLGAATCALPLPEVLEIVRRPAITPVPLAPPAVRGLISLRGRILPVVDPREVLGLETGPSDPGFVLVVSAGEDLVGLLVDELGDVIEARPEFLEPPVACNAPAGATVRGVHLGGSELIVALDLERVLERVLARVPETAASGADRAPHGRDAP